MSKLIEGTDMPFQGGVMRFMPAWLHPYGLIARWDRPIGVWLLLFPCFWGILLATELYLHDHPVESHPGVLIVMALFTLGAIVMRGAGCTVNDIFDRDYDAKVLRTRMRPLASGAISVKQALLFLGIQAGIGLLILLQFNLLTILLGIASLALVVPYPLMKRITYWPQAWLGLTFNWGALMGMSVILNDIPVSAFLLYAGCFFWTVGYDTIYAHQDKEDDVMVGVKSSALRLGRHTLPALILFYSLTTLLIGTAFWHANVGIFAWAGLTGCVGHFAYQIYCLDIDNPDGCRALFNTNKWVGVILTIGLFLNMLELILATA